MVHALTPDARDSMNHRGDARRRLLKPAVIANWLTLQRRRIACRQNSAALDMLTPFLGTGRGKKWSDVMSVEARDRTKGCAPSGVWGRERPVAATSCAPRRPPRCKSAPILAVHVAGACIDDVVLAPVE